MEENELCVFPPFKSSAGVSRPRHLPCGISSTEERRRVGSRGFLQPSPPSIHRRFSPSQTETVPVKQFPVSFPELLEPTIRLSVSMNLININFYSSRLLSRGKMAKR